MNIAEKEIDKLISYIAREVNKSNEHIASLVDALKISTDSCYEWSSPVCVGGPTGVYTVRAPFIGDCQYKVDIASCGATAAQVIVSSVVIKNAIDYVAAFGLDQINGLEGLAMNLPATNTVPIDSEWYNIRNSENTVYVNIFATSNAAFVNLVFRQKRH